MSSNQHLYFCIDSTCNNIVDHYNAPCCLEHNPLVQGNEETLSHETSECPGCGMDLYVGANGYCSHCWVERFGYDEECGNCWRQDCVCAESPISHECTNTFDHEVGQWTCGDADAHKCSGEWDYDRGIRVCDFADEPECPQHKCTNTFDHEIGQWTCGDQEAHNRYPPLPPSPVATDLDDQIDAIEEKLKTTRMTEGQTADWEFLWHNAKRKQREQNCQGCRQNSEERDDHMWHEGGCLTDAFWEANWNFARADDQRRTRRKITLAKQCA